MAEIITESFCERCGTRYTFEAATPKKRRIGKLRVLSKGLKNYVLSDDASLDEALAEARSDDERERSGGQLDAFHQTFQFCMSCRQYTCANCWNETEGRCLSCAPMAIAGSLLRSPLDDLLAGGGMAPLIVEPDATEVGSGEPNGHNGSNGHNGHNDVEATPAAITGSAWPTIDLFRIPDVPPAAFERTAGQIVPASPTEEVASGETATHLDTDATLETGPTTETGAEPEAELSSAAEFWMRPFTGFAPGPEATNGHDHADATLSEPEPEPEPEAVSAAEPEPEAVSAAEPEPEPEAVSAADDRAEELAGHTARLLGRFRVPDASGQTPTPAATAETLATAAKRRVTAEPVQAEPVQAEPVAAPSAPVTPAAPAVDIVEVPTWPLIDRRRPVAAPLPAAAAVEPAPVIEPPVAPAVAPPPAPAPTYQFHPPVSGAAPQWPAPLTPGIDLSVPPFWASGDAGRVERDGGLWSASSQEVIGAPGVAASPAGVQSCVKCGLSLSATARFCRRCGSRQG